jgi:hypothetical protein
MPQKLLQREHIAAVDQILNGESMAAEMGMETLRSYYKRDQ